MFVIPKNAYFNIFPPMFFNSDRGKAPLLFKKKP